MCPDYGDTDGDNQPTLPDLGDLPVTVSHIEFQSHQQVQPDDMRGDDTAGPAQTLHARFHAVRSPANH